MDSNTSSDEYLEDGKLNITARFNDIIKSLRGTNINLHDASSFKAFVSDNADIFGKSTTRDSNTLLHLLVDDAKKAAFERYQPLIKHLVETYPELLSKQNDYEMTPLYSAISKKREKFLRYICEIYPHIDAVLGIPCIRSENCIHLAIRRNILPKLSIYLIGLANEASLSAKDDNGNTPLHLAVEYSRCTSEQLEVVAALISKCDNALDARNNESLSPFLYHERTCLEANVKIRSTKDRSSAQKGENDGDVPLRYMKKEVREVKKEEKKEEKNSKYQVTEHSALAIKDLMKLHCLRTRDHDQAVDFLFGQSQEKQIYFDLFDLSSLAFSQERIVEGLDHLDFEDTLQYVALPRLRLVKRPFSSKFRGRSVSPDGQGCNDMEFCFNFLRMKGVKRIIRVIVDDSVEPSHSDEAMERALAGLHVELWDWRKRDLSILSIFNAAPDVREITLYWSGNVVVLRGWEMEMTKSSGLGRLERLNVNIGQGLEKATRTNYNIREFEKSILEILPNVKIYIVDEQRSKESVVVDVPAVSLQPTDSYKWLTCMDDFADLITNVLIFFGNDPVAPITIALIDDGVDIYEQYLTGKIVGGKSFCQRDTSKNLNIPWYITSGNHGTIMAILICRIFPQAQIYVLKLDEHDGGDGTRKLSLTSAAKAIQTAIDRKVDIISMPWGISRTPDNTPDIEGLETAIEAASHAGILMFCAANDEGIMSGQVYPAAVSSKNIFRIDSRNDTEAAAATGSSYPVDFTFPGQDAFRDRPNRPLYTLDACKTLTTSGVAAAFATGLAALILYCLQFAALQREEELARVGGVSMQDFGNLKSHARMRDAFRSIGMTEEKYLEVWKVFGPAAKEVRKGDGETSSKIINEVANRLVWQSHG